MLGQYDFNGMTKLEATIERIKTFEPDGGYYVAFSGGKDSQCIYELCKMAGVKFDAHYTNTSVDPPELIYFIREHYPDVETRLPVDDNGKRISMWSLIEENTMPPTRMVRYCCEKLKESGGKGRVTMTGVRWAESVNRRKKQGLVTIMNARKKDREGMDEIGAEYSATTAKGVVLNLDNSESRRAVELCYRTRITLVNPIIDWDEAEVWEFLNDIAKVSHCKLYDDGLTRIGCIGCPMSGGEKQRRDFARWPKYKDAYHRAFERMLKAHPEIRSWKTADEVMAWWLGEYMNKPEEEEDET